MGGELLDNLQEKAAPAVAAAAKSGAQLLSEAQKALSDAADRMEADIEARRKAKEEKHAEAVEETAEAIAEEREAADKVIADVAARTEAVEERVENVKESLER
jgi:hypothetical protein